MKSTWKYIDFFDLVSSQVEMTRLSYNTHSHQYAEDWEWNKEIMTVAKRDYINPFMDLVKKEGVALIVGCGTGRDLKLLKDNGYRCLGIDSSEGMLREAVEARGIQGPVLCTDLESLKLASNSFDGVLIDSALEHIKKSDMKIIMEKLYECLRKNGIVLIRFRIGDGRVFEVEDSIGTRFFTSYTKKESKKLVTLNGFQVVTEYVTDHLENSRPGFHSYILRK